MLFRLALAMGRTLKELRAVLSFAEFQEWCLYYQIEPWGETRADLRSGIIASTLHNIYASWVGSNGQATPSDYMPYLDQDEQEKRRMHHQTISAEEADWIAAATGNRREAS